MDTPHIVVTWIFVFLILVGLFLSFFTPVWGRLWSNALGTVDANGMRRSFFFNPQPYLMICYITVAILLSAAVAALALFIVGGAVFVVLWIVKILVWCIIVIGWIAAIGGVLCVVFLRDSVGCLFPAIGAIVGGVIVAFDDALSSFGNKCVDAGFSFFETLNIWGFCADLAETYYVEYIAFSLAPIALGLSLALLMLFVSFILWLTERIVSRRYGIKHPCPFCHNVSEPAIYLSEGNRLPVHLRPGEYGIFHITHPVTKEKMPTMIFNGRDKLERRCPHCDRVISYNVGMEKHIAFVGLPESGKTTLTYRFLGNLMRNNSQIKFTDEVSKEVQRIVENIKNGEDQELAAKTNVIEVKRSIQILIPDKKWPYHLFVNDVGGELFTTSGVNTDHVQFFKDVNSVALLIDPSSTDFRGYELGPRFRAWIDSHNDGGDNMYREKITSVFNTVKVMSYHFIHDCKAIHMNVVLVKSDMGYLDGITLNEQEIREYVVSELGLGAEVYDIENTYASVHFYAVSALRNQGIETLTHGIFDELHIKI